MEWGIVISFVALFGMLVLTIAEGTISEEASEISPEAPVQASAIQGEEFPDGWLTPEEEAHLLAASPAWLREIISIALNTGMQLGEILSLQWQDVDFVRGILVVMKSKNHERRTIPLNMTVFALLVEKQGASGRKDGVVFTTLQGTPLEARYVIRAFAKARDRAGIAAFRFHDLRHTFAIRLIQRGVDLYKVQRVLGHKTGVMTQRYAHHSRKSLRDRVRVLEKISYYHRGAQQVTYRNRREP